MSMMLKTVNPAAAEAIESPTKVGVGNVVVYHARAGYMRDKRSSFPALVMRQHADDGSLDLLVFMEREDFALEERVVFQSHNQPHHCWAVVEDAPGQQSLADSDGLNDAAVDIEDITVALSALAERVKALENKRGPGRPKKVTLA